MDVTQEVRDSLLSRRARITPEKAGLPTRGANRRVTGLRREEVALANALQRNEAERAHLYEPARASAAPLPRSFT